MNPLENTKIHVKTENDAQILRSIADVMGFADTHIITSNRFIFFRKNGEIARECTNPVGVRYFTLQKEKEITFKDLTPPKNADLMELQAKGVHFSVVCGTPNTHCIFTNDREDYLIHFPSVFEEVPPPNPNAEKIEHIESEMRRLADELKELKEQIHD